MAISILAVCILLVWLFGGLEAALGSRSIPYLRDQPVPGDELPLVSIIIAARNEAETIRRGLESMAAQRGLAVEVILVDDRSTDDTGRIAKEVADSNDHVSVVRIEELPEGWLGKTHALERGAEQATGEWLLFTDADIVMEPHALARAVGFAQRSGADHLAITPELKMPTVWADAFGSAFVLLFSRYSRPWRARDPQAKEYIGIGAFNLVRREVHTAVGGHAAVRLRPDDDLMLGKVIKRSGYQQELLYGTDQVRVAWYPSLGSAIRGLEKNSFAGMGYSVPRVLVSCAALVLLMTWPWVGVLTTEGVARAACIGSCLVMSALYFGSSLTAGTRPWLAPLLPVSALIICYAVLRSTTLAVRNHGIRWRDTLYGLDSLRAFRV